ncbi:MAG: class I SAM-dependent methyltransferase [bacterium]|nr:class I SAM-dependent methyltransferase [bacterium]
MHPIIQKTRLAYNRIAGHFSGTRYDLWPDLKDFESLVQPGQNILDWGCGNGRLILLLKTKKVKYFGLDQSEELVKMAEAKYAAELEQGWVKFTVGTLAEQNFTPDWFDLVFMIASFHHLPDRSHRLELLKLVYTLMKPGGRLIMTNWNLGSDWAKAKIARSDWTAIDEHNFLIPWKNPDGVIEAERCYHLFMPDELSELLTEVGFTVERMDYGDATFSDSKGGRNLVTVAIK